MNGFEKPLYSHLKQSCTALKAAMDADFNHDVDDCGDSVDAPFQTENLEASNCLSSSSCDLTNDKSSNIRYNRQIRSSSSGSLRCAGASIIVQQNSQQAAESVVDLCRIKEEAIRLGRDIVLYMTSKGTGEVPKTNDSHALTLRRTVDDLSKRHEIPFSSMTRKLQMGESGTSCQSIVTIADEMFADGQYNWGRIITLYAFAGWLAKYCVDNNVGGNWVEKIGDTVGHYVANHLSDWIARQGGWVDMDRFFPVEENMESKIWKSLLYTMLGLGALATTVAAVR